MRLGRLGQPGAERPVAVDVTNGVDVAYDLTPVTDTIDGAFLADDGIVRTRDALAAGRLPRLSTDGMRWGAPIAQPAAVVCLGLNYAEHAAESGVPLPEETVVFFKHPNTVVGPNDEVLLPRKAERVDWEVELAAVIGRRARYLDSPEEALSYVAGFATSNDVSERSLQLDRSGGQWSKGKSAETFNPLGPWLVPADELDPQALRLRSWVNGEVRQDSTTADMVFSVAHIVWELSQFMTLDPGDVVNTGTPQGVALSGRFPYLTDGDVVEVEIEGLGRQRQVCRSAD